MYRGTIVTLGLLCSAGSALRAQGRVLDSGTLLVTRDGELVGREEFSVTEGRASGPGGFTISVRSFYPADRPEPVVLPQVELGPDSQPVSTQIVERSEQERRVYLQAENRRVTVRSMSPSGESVRQFPSSERLVVADDSALALYAIRPGSSGWVGQIWPRDQRRDVNRVEALGQEMVEVDGSSLSLQHFVLGAANQARHLWYDSRGRLMKVHIPASGLTATRSNRT